MPSLLKEALTACRHSVSDTISFPLSGCFSPFPHGTSSLSVIKEYLGLGSGLPIFRQNFTCSALLENKITFYLYGTITHYGLTFQNSSSYYNFIIGLIRVRSSLLTEYISFPLATKIFQFTRFTLISYEFTNK